MPRWFEPVKGYEQAKLPERKTVNSAGYDFYATDNYVILPNNKVIIPTGMKVHMHINEFLGIYIRSSYGINKGLKIANGTGIIDSDYYNNPDNEGHIFIAVENFSDDPVYIKKGECFAQGVFQQYFTVTGDSAVARRMGGIGSSDK